MHLIVYMNMKNKILNEIENVDFEILVSILKDNFNNCEYVNSSEFLKEIFVEQIEHLFEEIENL